MIQLFDTVSFFMDMVNVQVNRAVVTKYPFSNSYDRVVEIYVFGGILRGVKCKPLKYFNALWLGEGTTIEDIRKENERLAEIVAHHLKEYDVKLPPAQ